MHSEPMASDLDPDDTPAVRELLSLPRSEQREALEALVVGEFRAVLLMDRDEDFPSDASFFDLGFTSLLMADAKDRLEWLLGRSISSTVLFNSPTVDRLIDHLAGDVLALRHF